MQVTIPPRIVVRSTGTAGAPTAGSWNLDELCLDAGGDLWYCTAAGDFAATTPTFSKITTGGAGTITSVFGRAGPAIVAAIGDYTAAQVSNAADTSAATTQTFTGEVVAPSLGASGITGTQAGRFVGICGGTTGPASGTFQAGDCVVDGNGVLWVCTTAGTIGSGCVFTDRVSGGGPNPATTVTGPDAYGAAAAVGTGTTYARADHDHGLPAAPAVPAPAATVTGPDAYGAAAAVGTGTTYARADHDHGLPAAPGEVGQPYGRYYGPGTAIPTGTTTQVALNANAGQGYGMIVNGSSFVVVPTAGLYEVLFAVEMASGAGSGADYIVAVVVHNGSYILSGSLVPSYTTAPGSAGGGLVPCAAGDTLGLYLGNTSGSALTTAGSANLTFLHVVRHGPT